MADFSTTPPVHGDTMNIAGAAGDSFRISSSHYAAIEVVNLGTHEMTVSWAIGGLPAAIPVLDAANSFPVRAGEVVPFDVPPASTSDQMYFYVIGTAADRMHWRGRGGR